MIDDVEAIGDNEILSRLVIDRTALPPSQYVLIWNSIFEFPDSAPESLFWNKYLSDAQIHAKGCAKQWEKRKTNPSVTYRGFVSGSAGTIRAFRTPLGHGFRIEHEPSEGIFHVHLFYQQADGAAFTRSHKNELKVALGRIFAEFNRHTCLR